MTKIDIFSQHYLSAMTWTRTHSICGGPEIPGDLFLTSVAPENTCKDVTEAKQRTESRIKRTALLLAMSIPSPPA